ncbi:MAG: DUF6064 family protein, partial [Candidatus Hodarchaeales archaeon]
SLALLFLMDLRTNRITFKVPEEKNKQYYMYFSLVMVLLYPLIGLILGHQFPRMIIYGVLPCPTVALALVFISASLPKTDWKIISLLIFWAVPFPVLFQIPIFGVYEDAIMLWIGLSSLYLWMYPMIKEKRSK